MIEFLESQLPTGTCSVCGRSTSIARVKCETCLERRRRAYANKRPIDISFCKNDGTPRPAWMSDPSLLPKAPPSRRAA